MRLDNIFGMRVKDKKKYEIGDWRLKFVEGVCYPLPHTFRKFILVFEIKIVATLSLSPINDFQCSQSHTRLFKWANANYLQVWSKLESSEKSTSIHNWNLVRTRNSSKSERNQVAKIEVCAKIVQILRHPDRLCSEFESGKSLVKVMSKSDQN